MARPSPPAAAARTLADALRGWDDAALAGLVTARPDLARPAPADLAQLAARAAGRGSVAMAVDRLDTAHLSVLEALALLPAPVTTTDVQRLVDAAPGTVASVLDRLRSLALVWGEPDDLRLVRAAHDVVGPAPAGLGPSLSSLLGGTRPARVHTLAEDLGLPPAGDPGGPPTGSPPPTGIRPGRRPASTTPPLPPATTCTGCSAGWPRGRRAVGWGGSPDVVLATARGALQHLLARALLVRVDDRTVCLPREIGLHLRGGRTTTCPVDAAPEPTVRAVAPDRADAIGAGAAYDTVRRVDLLLETWGTAPAPVLRSGGVGRRDLRALAAELDVSEEAAGALLEVASAAGLLAVGDDPELDEVWLPTVAFDEWRGRPLAERWALLATAWLDSPRAMVLVGGRDERDRPVNPLAPDLERGGAAAVRRATLQVLIDVGPGAAADDVEQVVDAVAWHRPRRVALRDALVRRTLVEAHALGLLADGAATTSGRLLLTDARAAAERLAPLLPKPVDHVVLQGDLTAVAPGPLHPAVGHGLALLADVESRGGATVYRFSADSVRRAMDAGWPASEVHAFLQTHSRTPVPQPLTYLVDDTARRHGRLRVGAAEVYLRADDPTELDTVLADPALASLNLRRVAPTMALTDQPADIVLARLRRVHRAPLLEGPDGRTVGATPGSRRARRRRHPATEVHPLDEDRTAAVVQAVRAGERARAARPAGERVTGPTGLVAELQAAAEDARTVWLAYLDETGTVSERVVDPVGIDGGRLTAYDHRSARTRTFALHRISSVATG